MNPSSPKAGTAAAFAVALIAACCSGCVDGSHRGQIPRDSDLDGTNADVSPLADLDTRTADGAHACGIFPDTCPRGFNCYTTVVRGEIERECASYGAGGAVGESCPEQSEIRCGDGLRCVDGVCRKICDPDDLSKFGCESDAVCVSSQLGGVALGWGTCVQRADKCTLWPNDNCPTGENCYTLEQGNRCLEYNDTARVGEACDGSPQCNDEQICIDTDRSDERGGKCRPKCDEDHPCDSGECQPVSGEAFGACIESS